jgi:hypothetical protein
LAFAGVTTIAGALLDYVVRDKHKSRVFDKLISIARVGSQPLSLAFYGLVTLVSVFFTVVVLWLNAKFHPPTGGAESDLVGLKSAAPILLAVVIKILCGDYLLALKSSYILREISGDWGTAKGKSTNRKWAFIIFSALVISVDLLLTCFLTEAFLNWGEFFQTKHLNNIDAGWATSIRNFFDSIDLVAKDAIQKSFYVLNGSLLMYLCALASLAATGTISHLNVKEMKKHIFKIIAGSGILLVLVVALVRDFAGK